MRFVLAIFLPPLAVLACKRPFQFVLNLTVWLVSLPLILFMGVGLLGWVFCTAHALFLCGNALTERRLDRVVRAIESNRPQPAGQPYPAPGVQPPLPTQGFENPRR